MYFGNIENKVWNFFDSKKKTEKNFFFKWYFTAKTMSQIFWDNIISQYFETNCLKKWENKFQSEILKSQNLKKWDNLSQFIKRDNLF